MFGLMTQSILDFASWDVIRFLLIWIYTAKTIGVFVKIRTIARIVALIFHIRNRVVHSRNILLVPKISNDNKILSDVFSQ